MASVNTHNFISLPIQTLSLDLSRKLRYGETCASVNICALTRPKQMDISESTSSVKYLTQTGATGFYRSVGDLTGDLFLRSRLI